jgi:hypothetical protein
MSTANQEFVAKFWSLRRMSLRCRIVLSPANQVFAAKLWCVEQISVRCRIVLPRAKQLSLLNCVVCIQSVCEEMTFHCRIVVSLAN